MLDKENAIVTMNLLGYESLVSDAEFWQRSYNRLYRIVRKYAEQSKDGKYIVPKSNYEPLAKAVEEFLYDRDC